MEAFNENLVGGKRLVKMLEREMVQLLHCVMCRNRYDADSFNSLARRECEQYNQERYELNGQGKNLPWKNSLTDSNVSDPNFREFLLCSLILLSQIYHRI